MLSFETRVAIIIGFNVIKGTQTDIIATTAGTKSSVYVARKDTKNRQLVWAITVFTIRLE